MARLASLFGLTLISTVLSAGCASTQQTQAGPKSAENNAANVTTCPLTVKSTTGALVGGVLGNALNKFASKRGVDGLGTVTGQMADAAIKGPDTPVECTSLPREAKVPPRPASAP